MEGTAASKPLAGVAKRFATRLLAVGENRFHLFVVELEEERDRMVEMVFLAIAIGALGLLGGMALTAALVIIFWSSGPLCTLFILAAVYAGIAFLLFRRLMFCRNQPSMPATMDQLRKDRACFTKS